MRPIAWSATRAVQRGGSGVAAGEDMGHRGFRLLAIDGSRMDGSSCGYVTIYRDNMSPFTSGLRLRVGMHPEPVYLCRAILLYDHDLLKVDISPRVYVVLAQHHVLGWAPEA